ncbi:hypothetical protein JOQ06_006447, partial [Pogonophryne albipinna]
MQGLGLGSKASRPLQFSGRSYVSTEPRPDGGTPTERGFTHRSAKSSAPPAAHTRRFISVVIIWKAMQPEGRREETILILFKLHLFT